MTPPPALRPLDRASNEHPDFPDSTSTIGFTDADRVDPSGSVPEPSESPLRMHYFDSRGVYRTYGRLAQ
jgi:hypothetical protein